MRRRRKAEDSGFNVWRSYSDMMAGVLLLFVLIMCVTLFQAQVSYNESLQEKDEKIRLQEEYTAELLAQQMTLDEQDAQIKEQVAQIQEQEDENNQQRTLLAEMAQRLKAQQDKLDAQQQELEVREAQLKEEQNEQDILRSQLEAEQKTVSRQSKDIEEKERLLGDQQQKIDNIIGVKTEVVESLKREFANNNVSVNIDQTTGALTLDANILFDVNESELTQEGEEALREVLPIYCRVLLDSSYKPYLGEIIIDGYTDTDGSYEYNLELSQLRSLAVAEYLLEISDELLSFQENIDLRNFLTVNGHSMSNPILNPDGSVNKDASRRVEVKFRLKDDEMIQELSAIMGDR